MFEHEIGEGVHMREQLFLGNESSGTRGDVPDPQAAPAPLKNGLPCIVATGEDVNGVPQPVELPRKLIDINVLAATIDSPRPREWRGMFTDDGDVQAHV